MFRRPVDHQADRHRKPSHIRLRPECLEDRSMLSVVPAYSSLPSAPKTLYLDFDGDFEPQWTRTDAGQVYLNIATAEYNKDNTAGFSATELSDIREIWQGVAEDYAPFNVNVTTVEPPAAAFTTNQALRVVIAGQQSAMLLDPHFVGLSFIPYDFISGNRFITNDGGRTLLDTSGYSSIGSFTSSEPNVVFVFAGYTNTWSNKDSEGHARNYDQLIATTASHEAGHAFGLSHHKGLDASGNASDYDVGTYLTTPIMGSNTSSDRTIWSKNATQDTVQILTSTLGARPDDVGSNFLTASNLPLIPLSLGTGIALKGYALGSASGVIGTTSDADWFHVTSTGGAFKFDASPVANGNLDIKLDLYQRTLDSRLGIYFTLVATADPAIPSTQPFSGLNASISTNLGSGDFYVVVRSHGSYGDLGQYTLTVSRSDVLIYQLPTTPILAQAIVPKAPDPGPLYVSSSLLQLSNVLGGGAGQVVPTAPPAPKATDLALADWGTPAKPVSKSAKLLATDQIFADWD